MSYRFHALSKIILCLLLSLMTSPLFAEKTTICEGTYALCAYSRCIPIPGVNGKALCTCEVKSGYSIGTQTCQTKLDTTSEGYQKIEARYYPVKRYVSCHNNRTWANCANSECVVNPNNPNQAICTCSTTQSKEDYMYASDSCSTNGCESGMISSYVVKDAERDFDKLKNVSNYDELPDYTPEQCPTKS